MLRYYPTCSVLIQSSHSISPFCQHFWCSKMSVCHAADISFQTKHPLEETRWQDQLSSRGCTWRFDTKGPWAHSLWKVLEEPLHKVVSELKTLLLIKVICEVSWLPLGELAQGEFVSFMHKVAQVLLRLKLTCFHKCGQSYCVDWRNYKVFWSSVAIGF